MYTNMFYIGFLRKNEKIEEGSNYIQTLIGIE